MSASFGRPVSSLDQQPQDLATLIASHRRRVPFDLTRALRRSGPAMRRFPPLVWTLACRLEPVIDQEFRKTALPDLLRDAIKARAEFDALVHPEIKLHGATLVATHDYDATVRFDAVESKSLRIEAVLTATFGDLTVGLTHGEVIRIQATALQTRTVLRVEGVEAITRDAVFGNYEHVFLSGTEWQKPSPPRVSSERRRKG
jgi:hypothetical protein